MAHPKYARFQRCDLQMQTPGDHAHWEGEHCLTPTSTDEECREAATRYAARCYDADLEVVGITDHNLGGELGLRFLEHLRREIQEQAASKGRRITLLPGFEIVAATPGNIHLLCLFDPETTNEELSHHLSAIGLKPEQRKRGAKVSRSLDQILQDVAECGGVVIAAHADRTNGALDDKRVAEGWQQDVIRNESLLCIELPRPRSAFANVSGKLGMIVRNDPGDWHREHPIAVVNSSDCKRLHEADGTSDSGWIGKRSTWIKMGRPSIEGLRQAFLDHESRIAFGDVRPEVANDHPVVERITIRGTRFVADQEIEFAPGLNALIGGGGTGKSTLLEWIRAGLDRQPASEKDVLTNHKNALQSLGDGAVEIHLRIAGEVLSSSVGAAPEGISAAFSVTAFSQREVFAVASSETATLALLDSFKRDEMAGLDRAVANLDDRVSSLDRALASRDKLDKQLLNVEGRLQRERALLKSLEEAAEPLAVLNRHRAVEEEIDRIDEVADSVERVLDDATDELEKLTEGEPELGEGLPFREDLLRLRSGIRASIESSIDELQRIRLASRARAGSEDAADFKERFASALAQAASEYDAVASAEEGDRTAPSIRQAIRDLEHEQHDLQEKIQAVDDRVSERRELLQQLHDKWSDQTLLREELAERLKSLVPVTDAGTPFVTVSVHPFADTSPMVDLLRENVHGNSLNQDEAEQIAAAALAACGPNEAPSVVLARWIRALHESEAAPDAFQTLGIREAVLGGLRRDFGQEQVHRLERTRTNDRVEVLLRRSDGSEAGKLNDGLSVGQKCTAVLALALAGGDEPILIDQPEDEIDNEFIYEELVPLLRRAKEQRQIIVATHNPNIPVNGDAELIYALEARSVDGRVRAAPKTVQGAPAIGPLDSTAVKVAVETIMEGSEAAFRRRWVRYGF